VNVGADAAFTWPLRVYYEDTDAGTVVYYANYLKYFERCRTEWLRTLGVNQSELTRVHGLQFVVTEVQIRYLRPALLDDQLTIEARVVRLGRCSLVFEQRVHRGAELLAQARIEVACIGSQRRPTRLPASLSARIRIGAARFQGRSR